MLPRTSICGPHLVSGTCIPRSLPVLTQNRVSDLKPNEVLRFSYLYYATSGRGSYRRMIVDYPLFGNFIQGALTPHQADKALEQLAMDLREADEEGSQFSEAGIALDDDSEEDTSDRSSDTGSA